MHGCPGPGSGVWRTGSALSGCQGLRPAPVLLFCCLPAVPAEKLAQFELKPEEREFQGESDDRKGLLEHRWAGLGEEEGREGGGVVVGCVGKASAAWVLGCLQCWAGGCWRGTACARTLFPLGAAAALLFSHACPPVRLPTHPLTCLPACLPPVPRRPDCRQKLQARVKELDAAKKAFIASEVCPACWVVVHCWRCRPQRPGPLNPGRPSPGPLVSVPSGWTSPFEIRHTRPLPWP